MTQLSQRSGNTLPRARKWIFVLHNYTNNDVTNIINTSIINGWSYLFSKETGQNDETPHLQGYFEMKNAVRFDTLKKLHPQIHLEKAKGNLQQQFDYILKEDGEYFTNIKTPYTEILEPTITEFKNWQQKVINIMKQKPERRTIYWIYDENGNSGKTELCRYLFRKNEIMWIRTAKTNDIKHILSENKNCRDIIFDLPRDSKTIDYTLLEELKDGLLFSGKYEGKCKEIAIPHIFIMSNQKPNLNKMSKDRIIEIEI